jgi:hypothetical protein
MVTGVAFRQGGELTEELSEMSRSRVSQRVQTSRHAALARALIRLKRIYNF